MNLSSVLISILLVILSKDSSCQEYQGANHLAGVDKIETIDVTPTQIIISTTKIGPVENLHVFIDVVDIENGVHLPPMNLSGLLLLITRGRYTVNFLRPSTWYGVAFYSEQRLGDEHHAEFDEKLVRTMPSPDAPSREDDKLVQKPPMQITASREDGKGKSIENLLITLKWILPRDYRTNLQAVANISLYCKDQTRYKLLKLADEESAKAVQVKLDNTFEITHRKNTSRQIVANIMPKTCHRLCWTTQLVAPLEQHNFAKNVAKNCKEIAPVQAETSLRDYLSYDVQQSDLIIHTNISGNTEVEDAVISIEAMELPNGVTVINNLTNKIERFRATQADSEFVMHGLDPTKWYAVQYSYVKRFPFAYTESERFVVESRTAQTKSPLKVHFTSQNPSGNGTNSTEVRPRILMSIDPSYKDVKIGVDVDPFCDAKGPNSSHHFWLSSEHPQHELKELNLLAAICGAKPEHTLCGVHDESSHVVPGVSNVTVCSSPNLCYAGNLEIKGRVYAMKKRCVNVANYFPILEAETEKKAKSRAAQALISRSQFLVIFVMATCPMFVF